MGTRSLTRFIETHTDKNKKKVKTEIVVMYRQFDGYPTGHGKELADFMKKGVLVNGIGAGKGELQFNGMGCLSAQVVAEFKDGPGGIYLHAPKTKNCGEEYVYEIEGDFDTKKLTLRCYDVGYMKGDKYINKNKLLFKGEPKDFDKFLEKAYPETVGS